MGGTFKLVKLLDPIQFTNVAGGLVPKGAFNGATTYSVGDSVDYNGSSYVLFAAAVAGTLPTDTSKWQVLANKGATGAAGTSGGTLAADTDGTLAANSDSLIATQKATKTYADTKVLKTTTVNGHALGANVTVTATDVSLGNVDNTSDVNKPVSTAQATADALNLKIASNLSDLNNTTTARTNLGLGTLATQSGTFSGTSSGTNTGDAPVTDVQVFTGNGTWTKPTNAKAIHVFMVGGGAGGGAGYRGATGTIRGGGGGGGSGAITWADFPASDVTATVAIVVGAAGNGAVGQVTDNTVGANGVTAGGSGFGSYTGTFSAGGGVGGKLGAAANGGASGFGLIAGMGGGAGTATGAATAGGLGIHTTGGGSGGGITAAEVQAAGGAGGGSLTIGPAGGSAGAAGGAISGGAGSAGTSTGIHGPGIGAGGGGANTGGVGGAGGAGGSYGGGGGGGGASSNGTVSGAGGNGSPGVVVVTTYF